MNSKLKISSVLLSVYSKAGLAPVIKEIDTLGIKLYSTGGTQKYIEELGVDVTPVESITSYPSILGGRVKTLHPKIFGGILNRRDSPQDQGELQEYDIPKIDMVIVDLYPFEDTVSSGAEETDVIEKIDIGGVSLIRAAAKNFRNVLCIPSKDYYGRFLELMSENRGSVSLEDRRVFAREAFNISSHYDTAIFNYFNTSEDCVKISYTEGTPLRYGENPHQKGTFFGALNDIVDQLHGRELSYNNLLDVDAAISLINEFVNSSPTFAILKHNNACGVASSSNICDAYEKALEGDPISAFGGVLISNKPIDLETAHKVDTLFFEVIIAPSYADKVLDILSKKKNRIILKQKSFNLPDRLVRSCLNGLIAQDKDIMTDDLSQAKVVTMKKPSLEEMKDLEFASKICKHTKSNAIVLVKNSKLLASGAGQMSRIDALSQAVEKAKSNNNNLNEAVMASDAFFPFPDCVLMASKEKITSILQPGGSIKDQLSIDTCNKHNISMVFTKTRHFKH